MKENKILIILIICILLVMAIMVGLVFLMKNQEEIPQDIQIDTDVDLLKDATIMPLDNKSLMFAVEDYLREALNSDNIYVWKIYMLQKSYGETYFAQIVTTTKGTAFVVVNTDNTNNAYEIEKITKEQFDNAIEGKMEQKYIDEITIQNNGNNNLKFKYVLDEEISKAYFEMIKDLSVNYPEIIYERLTEEYKAAKFNNSYEEFAKFCDERKDFISKKKYNGYKLSAIGKNKVYTCRDTGHNVYKIIEENAGEFTLELDEYTIYSEEFITLYNKADANTKVTTNVEKFIKLVNNQDYTEAYAILNESFKKNNFPTKESYAKYLSENYNKSNLVTIKEIEEQGEYHLVTFDIKPGDRMATEEDNVTRKAAIKLKDNTEFEMSIIIEG